MMTAAAKSEKLPIKLIADAHRKIRSNLGRLAVLDCAWVMDCKRVAPTNDALSGALFLREAPDASQTPTGRAGCAGRSAPVCWPNYHQPRDLNHKMGRIVLIAIRTRPYS